jgi:hypothetical protein
MRDLIKMSLREDQTHTESDLAFETNDLNSAMTKRDFTFDDYKTNKDGLLIR